MSADDAATFIHSAIAVTREDISRAKSWLVRAPGSNVSGMADQWLKEQDVVESREVNFDSLDAEEQLTAVAKAYSVRLAFYQAVWELVAGGLLFPASTPGEWEARLVHRTSHGASGIPLKLRCSYIPKLGRPPFASEEPADADVFLKGIDCSTLHPGIRVAIEQALTCFRRALYMPATAMLAAAAEATWTECGTAVAKKLADMKLDGVVNDPFSSIAKKVTETRKTLERPDGKALLKSADCNIADITNAEVWTTVECSPKPDPCVMRVSEPDEGKETFDEEAQEAQSGTDRSEASRSGCDAFGW